MTDSFVRVLDWALGWWLGGHDPGLAFIRRTVSALDVVTRWTAFAALAVAVVVALTMLTARRRGSDLADLVVGVGRFLLVMSGGWLLLAAAWSASDGLGRWIIGERGDRSGYVGAVEEAMQQADPTMARTLAVVGTAAVLGFVAVVVARLVVTILVAVALPVLAAASLGRRPRVWRGSLAWVLAVLAFQPLAAVVYRASHGLVTDGQDPVLVLVVVCLTFLLIAALLPGVARLATT